MENLKFVELPFYEELFNLSMAMQYCLADINAVTENGTNYQKQTNSSWLKKVVMGTNKYTYNQIVDFKKQHEQALQQNPILLGIIDMYLKTYNANSANEYKDIYEEFQNLQNQYTPENNMQNYIDMGCILKTGYLIDSGKIKLTYPIYLYTAHKNHGGKDDDHKNGYLFPTHELTVEEIKSLHETNPELFKSDKVKNAYNSQIKQIIAHQPNAN